MNNQGFFTRLGVVIDDFRAISLQESRNQTMWMRWFLPTPGNVIFTLLVIGSLLWAQSVGAVSLAAPVVNSSLTIPYQGRLANASGTPFTGNQNMEFRLYNVPSGGTPLWSELWTGGNSVTVNDGLFSVLLGSLTAGLPAVVQSNGQLWLGITVGTDGEMSPRVQLGSAAYSMQALTVPDGSVTGAKIADGSVTKTKLGDTTLIRTVNQNNAKIQSGYVQGGNTCDGDTIIFPQPFSQTPLVVISQHEAVGGNAHYVTTAVSTTGFKVAKVGPDACEHFGYIAWIAIGS